MLRPIHRRLASLTLLVLYSLPIAAQDWPRWMGPQGAGKAADNNVFDKAKKLWLREGWRREIGHGYSALSIVDRRAFTMESDDSGDYVLSLGADDGIQRWRFRIPGPGSKAEDYAFGTLSTPTVDRGQVFALGPTGRLHALRAEDGKPLWSQDLVETFAAKPPAYGISTSPLVVDDHVVILAGGREANNLIALDRNSGELTWSVSHARLPSYASPVLGILDGERQIVVPAGDRLYAVDLSDGRELWSTDKLSYPERSPLLLSQTRLFMPLEEAAVMLEVRRDGQNRRVEEIWRSEDFKNSYSPVVFSDGALFGFSAGSLLCLDATSSDALWSEELTGTLVLVDEHLVVMSHYSGRLRVIPANRAGFKERLSVQVFEKLTSPLTPPSFADGWIYVRSSKDLIALEVVEGDEPASEEQPADELALPSPMVGDWLTPTGG